MVQCWPSVTETLVLWVSGLDLRAEKVDAAPFCCNWALTLGSMSVAGWNRPRRKILDGIEQRIQQRHGKNVIVPVPESLLHLSLVGRWWGGGSFNFSKT